MPDLPLVTVGIPNYNYARYVTEALNSLKSQTYINLEVIVVDDCSTDHSVEVIEGWISDYTGPHKISFIKNNVNQGLTKVCNQILYAAKGKYFQTLDADDLLLPSKIERQVNLLEAAGDSALIYSNIGVIDEDGNMVNADYLGRIGYDKNNMPQQYVFEELMAFNFIPLPSVLVNTTFAKLVGGFDPTLQVQDYYLWLKLSQKHPFIYNAENTALYRVHSSSMSNSSTTNPKSIDSILKIKYDYYKNGNKQIRNIIKRDIHNLGSYLYMLNYPTAHMWLKKNVSINKNLKSLVYFLAISLRVPFSLFAMIKEKFNPAN